MAQSSGQTENIAKEIKAKKVSIVLDEFEKFMGTYSQHEKERIDAYKKYCDLIMSVDDPHDNSEVEDYADKYDIKSRLGHQSKILYCKYVMDMEDEGDLAKTHSKVSWSIRRTSISRRWRA
mgnify:CR=1 FL=1